ncbi:MAG: hypothetical protein IIY71_05160, partial [Oscillospiraceae bacterium]|nr:hypothetical protein [Oscillospiraceae bacterium]
MSKRKWIELCKTLGIFLLMLSAVFLAVRAFFIPGLTGKSFDYLTSEWFSLVKGYDQDSEQEENQVAALPIRIVAISSERKQCIQYNTDMLEAVFRQVSG